MLMIPHLSFVFNTAPIFFFCIIFRCFPFYGLNLPLKSTIINLTKTGKSGAAARQKENFQPRRENMNNYFVWVDMGANRKLITDPALFAEILDKCVACGFDSVTMGVKNTAGFVLHPSRYAPHIAHYSDDFEEKDYLKQCIDVVHEKGLKFYAAPDVFTEGNKKKPHPMMKGLTRPGWACDVYGLDENDEPVVQSSLSEKPIQTIGSIDDFGEIFVNPANDEVVEYELALIGEIINNYDVDGIALDRVRYVGISSDFSPLSINKWKQMNGIEGDIDLADIYRPVKKDGKMDIEYGKYFSSFNTFRAQMIHDFILKVRQVVDNANKKVEFIDYTGSWYPLYYLLAANWASPDHIEESYPATDGKEYAKTGYVRHVDRMMSGFYYEDVEIREAEEHNQPAYWYSVEGSGVIADKVIRGEKPILGSLFLDQYKNDPRNIQRAVDMCFKKSQGCMIFDLCYLVRNDWFQYAMKPKAE